MTAAGGRVVESSRITELLRDTILDGVRRPGSRLIERDLAVEFGVSRLPVRDALKNLEVEGLVTLRPRTGAAVREFSETELAELDEVRVVFEPLAFRLAAQRRSEAGLDELRRTLERERAAAFSGEMIAVRRAAADFHEVATALSGNHLLVDVVQSMRSRLRWLLGQHDDVSHRVDEHQALFDAIEACDADLASALALAHVDTARRLRTAHELRRAATASGDAPTA